MGRWAPSILCLVFFCSRAAGQGNAVRPPCVVSGVVVAEGAAFENTFDIGLVNESERPVAIVTAHSSERFTFSDLDRGVYFIVADVSGFKAIRQRADCGGVSGEVNLSIDLEAEPVVLKEPRSSDDHLVTTVSRMAQPPALLKELAAAEKKLHGGSIDQARLLLEAIVARSPDFYDAHSLLGMAYQASHRYRDAEREYESARNLNPASSVPWIGLGSIYLEQIEVGAHQSKPVAGTLEAARDAFLQAIKLDPGKAFGHYLLGVAYYKLALYDKAEGSLIQALEREPTLGLAHLALANVYIRTESWSRALAQIDAYIKENPRAPDRDQLLAKRSMIERMTAG